MCGGSNSCVEVAAYLCLTNTAGSNRWVVAAICVVVETDVLW